MTERPGKSGRSRAGKTERQVRFVPVAGALSMATAALVGATIQRLGGTRKVTPSRFVEDARRKDAPTHGLFDWNDRTAAASARIDRARYLIRHVEIEYVSVGGETQRMPAAVNMRDGSGYTPTPRVLGNKEVMQQFEALAKRDLVAFFHKYEKVRKARGLKPVFDVIEREIIEKQN